MLQEGRWLRSEPEQFFWNGQVETLDTPHYHAIYAVEDRDFTLPIVRALEKAYPQVCRHLGCTEAAAALTCTLKLNGISTDGCGSRGMRASLPSLRHALPAYLKINLLTAATDLGITVATVQRAYYNAATQWNGDADGHIVFNAIISWPCNR